MCVAESGLTAAAAAAGGGGQLQSHDDDDVMSFTSYNVQRDVMADVDEPDMKPHTNTVPLLDSTNSTVIIGQYSVACSMT